MKDVLTRIAAKCPERFYLGSAYNGIALHVRSVVAIKPPSIARVLECGGLSCDMFALSDLVDEFNLCPLLARYEGPLSERILRALADKLEGEEEARG